jgi:crotonobetainyl-CoA:carnitine CoA-transferase CaiB-like acyl-CoA transferase
MYPDGLCFDGKEEHVWMSLKGFEEYEIGDSVSFFADVYRYVKTSNGKQIDYSLREPQNIEKIENYKLPADKELAEQQAEAKAEEIKEAKREAELAKMEAEANEVHEVEVIGEDKEENEE